MSMENEDQLRRLTIQMRDQYRIVAETIAGLGVQQNPSANVKTLDAINQKLRDVKNTEAELRPIRKRWQQFGRSMPKDLVAVVEETIGIVNKLLPQIGELEKTAIELREKLTPHISQSVRVVQMQSAYARSAG